MAHDNCHARQAYVLSMYESVGFLSSKDRKAVADLFGCSVHAVYQDLVMIVNSKSKVSVYASASTKSLVRERDAGVCQYCDSSIRGAGVVEHVIPYIHGGHGKPYNLVLACNSCNSLKRSLVWIPNNLDFITADVPEWRDKVLKEAVPMHRPKRTYFRYHKSNHVISEVV